MRKDEKPSHEPSTRLKVITIPLMDQNNGNEKKKNKLTFDHVLKIVGRGRDVNVKISQGVP